METLLRFSIPLVGFAVIGLASLWAAEQQKKTLRFHEMVVSADMTSYQPFIRTRRGLQRVSCNQQWIIDALERELKNDNVDVYYMHVGVESILVHH